MSGRLTLLFIHRSVGQNLLNDGHVYQLVRETRQPFGFSDYNQNIDVLSAEGESPKTMGWHFPGEDTKPRGYAELFSNERLASNDPILQTILSYDIIAIKSCYPNSNIRSDAELEDIKKAYRQVIAFFSGQPKKKLAILTTPPLLPYMTARANAARARQLADWLMATTFGPNIFVYNFFDELATPVGARFPNVLRREYRRLLPFDPHPNKRANRTIASNVVAFLQAVADA